jgi:hypothetical protein
MIDEELLLIQENIDAGTTVQMTNDTDAVMIDMTDINVIAPTTKIPTGPFAACSTSQKLRSTSKFQEPRLVRRGMTMTDQKKKLMKSK